MSVIEQIISIIAPHYCTGCGLEGKLICEKCTVHIFDTKRLGCLLCAGSPNNSGVCLDCLRTSHVQGIWTLGAYKGTLERLIHDMKFQHIREAAEVIGELLARIIPEFEATPTVVPLPTAPRRIRQRGFDQSAMIARAIARHRSWQYAPLLRRNHNGRQVGSDRKARLAQAEEAYRLTALLRDRPVLLVDDVLTTGASIKAATALLHRAGYTRVMAAVAAKHPLKE